MLLAHRKHYFVDLLAGVRKGESRGGEQGKMWRVDGGDGEERRGVRDEGSTRWGGGTKKTEGQRRDEVAGWTVCLRKIKACRE